MSISTRKRKSSTLLAAILPALFSGMGAADMSSICPISAAATETTVRVAGRLFSTTQGTIRAVSPTRDCLACHDGTVARQSSFSKAAVSSVSPDSSASSVSSVSSSFSSTGQQAGDHPVDIVYPVADPRFRPLSEVERTLPLEGGLVTCNTCHSGSSPSNGYLTVSNFRSALCLTCHVK